jgi:hypothetical protein
MSAVHTSCCNILGLWHPCCTGASCVPVTWSGLDEYHLVAVGLWPDWLQLHGGMLHCSCSLQVITSSWWLGNLKEVTGLSVQEARDGCCMSAWAVCRTSEDPEERHWPGQPETSESMTTSGPDLSQKSESKNRPESQSKKLRIKN